MVKVCVEPATLFGRIDNRRMVQRYATDSPNNTLKILKLKFSFFRLFALSYNFSHSKGKNR